MFQLTQKMILNVQRLTFLKINMVSFLLEDASVQILTLPSDIDSANWSRRSDKDERLRSSEKLDQGSPDTTSSFNRPDFPAIPRCAKGQPQNQLNYRQTGFGVFPFCFQHL